MHIQTGFSTLYFLFLIIKSRYAWLFTQISSFDITLITSDALDSFSFVLNIERHQSGNVLKIKINVYYTIYSQYFMWVSNNWKGKHKCFISDYICFTLVDWIDAAFDSLSISHFKFHKCVHKMYSASYISYLTDSTALKLAILFQALCN